MNNPKFKVGDKVKIVTNSYGGRFDPLLIYNINSVNWCNADKCWDYDLSNKNYHCHQTYKESDLVLAKKSKTKKSSENDGHQIGHAWVLIKEMDNSLHTIHRSRKEARYMKILDRDMKLKIKKVNLTIAED